MLPSLAGEGIFCANIHSTCGHVGKANTYSHSMLWQSQVENEHYFTLSGLVASQECFIKMTPDLPCPFMND